MTLSEKFDLLPKKPKKNQKGSKKKSSLSRKKRTHRDGSLFSLVGVHGVGKTTVYELLKAKYDDYPNIKGFPERLRAVPPVPFGSKDKQIAFRAELHYQQQMIARNRFISQFLKNHGHCIALSDRSPISTLIYGRALDLPKIDIEIIFDTFKSVVWQKEIIIYLYAKPRTIMDRIYRRGSLDIDRERWNEDDFQYLLRVMNTYEEFFIEQHFQENANLFKIYTEEMTPHQVVQQITEIIELKTGIQLKNKPKIPVNQLKLTEFTPFSSN